MRRLALPVFLIIFCQAGCSTSPLGRKQLLVVPDTQMNQMGVTAFGEMRQKTPIETDPAVNRYVQCIALAIAAQAKDKTGVKDWEVVVFRDETANAFALPGGKIGVHTGILPVAEKPGQLAAVLGHEVGHVLARHGNERVSQNMAAVGGLTALSAILKEQGPKRDILMAALGLGTQVGLLRYSRAHESEADRIGLQLMAHAGFDPEESIDLWKNMEKLGGKQPPEFLSTHPSHESRIQNLESGMQEAKIIYQQADLKSNCKLQ